MKSVIKKCCKGPGVLWPLIVILTWTANTSAIPTFARLYKTSCLTCHVAPPKLTPFGEVFRQNGYQIPKDGGESIKEEPLKLGADGYKKVFPKAVWPGAIPGALPLSFRARTGFTGEVTDTGTFTRFTPATLQMMMAGTFSDNVTFFIGAHLFDLGVAGTLDRFYLQIDNILSNVIPEHLLFARIGQFIPEMVPFLSNHRSLTLTPYAMNTYDLSLGNIFLAGHTHGAGPFGLENLQIGAELSGVAHGRLRYVAGVVNGNGPNTLDNNKAKDFYGRISAKAGGMSFTNAGGIIAQSGQNWSEKSLIAGAFAYKGAKPNTGYKSPKDLDFYRVGGDLSIFFSDLNVFGGVIFGADEKVMASKLIANEYNLFFVEGNYIVFPWLIPVVRYEQANTENALPVQSMPGMDMGGTQGPRRLVMSVTCLLRANVKFIAEAPFDVNTNKFQSIQLGMDFSF